MMEKEDKSPLSAIKGIVQSLSPRAVFSLWLGGITLFAVLIWGLTGNIRGNAEIKAVNAILAENGDKRRIEAPISAWLMPGRATQAGDWFILSDRNYALVFTVPVDGVFAPFFATFSIDDRVDKIYPLTKMAEYCVKKTDSAILDVWMARLSSSAQHINKALEQ